DAVLAARRDEPWTVSGVPRLTAFMGGTDPSGAIVGVARQLALVDAEFDIVIVCPDVHRAAVEQALGSSATILAPTPELPTILAHSDIVVSAAGTSAWDICALGVPSLLVGVVDNQSAGLASAVRERLALGVDLVAGGTVADIAPAVSLLLADGALRERLSRASSEAFDGLGKHRVVGAMLATLGE
ncbi:MAG: hypothetical protein KKH51_05420, partial [Actinobacteria bacterium]|nr:hypothetical protein [Actinomycetota bacterium]